MLEDYSCCREPDKLSGRRVELMQTNWSCATCGFLNRASDAECYVCHRSRSADAAVEELATTQILAPERYSSPVLLLAAAVGGAALLLGVGFLLFRVISPTAPLAVDVPPSATPASSQANPTRTPYPSDAPGTHTVRTWDTLYSIAQSLGVSEEQLRYWNIEKYPSLSTMPRQIAVGWVLITDGPTMPTPTPRPTRQATPVPTAPIVTGGGGTGGGGSGWTQSDYETAVAYRDSVVQYYQFDVPNALWNAGAKLFGATCPQGTTPEERAACFKRELLSIAEPLRDASDEHLAFMAGHTAASCFADAYAADSAATRAYRSAAIHLLSVLGKTGDEWTAEMQLWDQGLASAKELAAQFIASFGQYFADCGS